MTNHNLPDQKVILVTGSSQGFGRLTVETLARQELDQRQDSSRRSRRGLVLVLTLCVMATGGCQRGPDAIQKAFDAVGGMNALLELRGFSYESSGERFEPAQGLTPEREPIKASSFALSLLCDVEKDRLSFDWQRQIFDPPLPFKHVMPNGTYFIEEFEQ